MMVKATGIVGLVILLCACRPEVGDNAEIQLHEAWSSRLGLIVTAAGSGPAVGIETGGKSIAPCYRTLARVDCHTTSLPTEQNRAVGYFHGN